MRFRFCGELDCPDWVLSEMNTLSRITSVKMKLLCLQVVRAQLGEEADYEKIKKLTADAKYDLSDVKASVAALTFILTSAAKHSVDDDSLSSELQQLGLPREHTAALCRAYADNFIKLQEEAKRRSLRLSKLEDVQWRVDYVVGSSHLQEVQEPMIHLMFKTRDPDTSCCTSQAVTFTMSKFRVFLSELKQAHRMMEGL